MREVSDLVYRNIKDFDDSNGSLLKIQISPIAAPAEYVYPFCVYKVGKRPTYSKQGAFEYDVQIRIVSEDYEGLCDISDALLNDFLEHKEFIYQETECSVNPDKPTEYIMNIVYQLFKY